MDQWSNLPEEIVDLILKKIDTPPDILNFSAVCKPWRFVSMEHMYHRQTNIPFFHFSPKRFPLPMLLSQSADDAEMYKLYSINEQRTYDGIYIPELKNKWICGSSRGWLVTVDKIDKHMHLLNPIERKQILLPHLSTFSLPTGEVYHHELNHCWSVMKANVFFGASGKLEDSVVVAKVTTGGKLCFCRIGDYKWKDIYKSPAFIQDVIVDNDLLYFVVHNGTLLSIDITTQKQCTAIACGAGTMIRDCNDRYLVESPIGLLMVLRISQWHDGYVETIGFRVLRLIKRRSETTVWYLLEDGSLYDQGDRPDHKWEEIESIGDLLIFVGYNYSLCLDSRLYRSSKGNCITGNCIYFADHELDIDRRRFPECPNTPHDIGVYHLEKKSVELMNGLCDMVNHHAIWLSPSM